MPLAPPKAQQSVFGAGLRSAFALVAAAAASLVFAISRSAPGKEWWFYAVGAALAVVAIALQVSKVVVDYRRDVEAANFRVQLRDALLPVTSLVADMEVDALAEVRVEQVKTVATAAVGGICSLVSPHAKRVRANVYWIEPTPAGEQANLVWLAHAGRGERPDAFETGTARGDSVFEFLQTLQPAFYPDLRKEKPEGYAGSMQNYTTFIAVPVWKSGKVYGMVTADAPKAKSLVLEDQHVIEMFADVMAIAFDRGMHVSSATGEKTEAGDTLPA